MKKFFLVALLAVILLGGALAYILYSEGFFDAPVKQEKLAPFEMKCEAGKCGAGKCAGG